MGIAIHQSKALFKAYHRLAENSKFIKGLVQNLHKTGSRTLVYTMIWFYPDNIESGGKFWLRNIKIRNKPTE